MRDRHLPVHFKTAQFHQMHIKLLYVIVILDYTEGYLATEVYQELKTKYQIQVMNQTSQQQQVLPLKIKKSWDGFSRAVSAFAS